MLTSKLVKMVKFASVSSKVDLDLQIDSYLLYGVRWGLTTYTYAINMNVFVYSADSPM